MTYNHQEAIKKKAADNKVLRFKSRCRKDPESGCWNWVGYINPKDKRPRYSGHVAARFSYALFVGPIPKDHEIDHTCRNPMCVNPKHLQPVTNREHRRRHQLSTLGHASLMLEDT